MGDKILNIIACTLIILIVAVIISLFYVNEQNTAKLKCVVDGCESVER